MAEKLEFDLGVKNNQLDKALDSGTKKASSLEGVLNTALGVFGGNVITKGFELFGDAIGAVVDITQEAITAAANQEVAINNLNNSLARAGNFTREASADLQAFASNLQAVSVFGDDVAANNLALLQSLTKLDKEGLKAGVQSAADFATVLGIDLESATRLVAKAANGQVEAFKRYGVEIQKGKTDTETFTNTIEALNRQFGGAASSQLNTFAGATASYKNALGDLLEPIGDIIVKNPLVVSTINEVKKIIVDITADIDKNKGAYIDFVQDGILATVAASQVLLDALDGITVVTKGLFNTLVLGANVISLGLVEPFRLAYDAVLLLLQNLPLVGKAFEGLQNPLDSLANTLRDNVSKSFDYLASSADGNVFRDLSDGASNFANSVIDGAERIKLANNEIKNSNRSLIEDQDVLNAEQLQKIADFNSEKQALEAMLASENIDLKNQLAEIEIQNEFDRNEASLQRILDQKLRENEIVLQAELEKNKGLNDARLIDAADAKAQAAKKLADTQAIKQKEIDLEKLSNQRRLAEQNSFLNTAASLSNSKSKELAAIGKAAAITNATIAARESIVNSFNFGSRIGGPPLGFTFAGIAAAATASQVAQIAGVQFENGGFVGGMNGASVGGDNRVATLREGEFVLNGNDQKVLSDAIKSGNLGGGDIVIQIDGREIFRAVRNQLNQGMKLA